MLATAGLRVPLSSRVHGGARRDRSAGSRSGHLPITITIDDGHPGPVVPGDFAGLSFERGPLNPGNAGVAGYLFSEANNSLVALFRNLGLGNLRIGGARWMILFLRALGSDGFTGIDNLFAFAAVAGVKVIYTFRLLSPGAGPIDDLKSINAQAAGYIWRHHREQVDTFAIGNEPDWHAFHTYAGHPLDPAIYEEIPGVPGSAYPSYLTYWQGLCRRGRGGGARGAHVGTGPRGLRHADLYPRPGQRRIVDRTVRPR